MTTWFADTVDLPHNRSHADSGCHACAGALIAAWNAAHPVGTPVMHWPGDERPPIRGRTSGPALKMAGGPAMVRIAGRAAAGVLTRVAVIAEEELDR